MAAHEEAGAWQDIVPATPLDAHTTPWMLKSITTANRTDSQRRTNDSLETKSRRMCAACNHKLITT